MPKMAPTYLYETQNWEQDAKYPQIKTAKLVHTNTTKMRQIMTQELQKQLGYRKKIPQIHKIM